MVRKNIFAGLLLSVFLLSCGGSDPSTPGCSVDEQKTWVRAYLDDAYYWYAQLPKIDAALYSTPADYFYALTRKSQPKDRFSFTLSQTEANALLVLGQNTGFGMVFKASPNLGLSILYVEPNSPAAKKGIIRGSEILAVNGMTPLTTGSNGKSTMSQPVYDALFPSVAGQSTTFEVRINAPDSSTTHITMASEQVTNAPVPIAKVITALDGKKVGYLVFNEHTAVAQDPLIAAINQFKNAGVVDLVLDLRYNGGGLLSIADDLASMIAGSDQTGQVFTRIQFNNKHTDKNATYRFINVTKTGPGGVPLPQLGLSRVFILTGSGTCSASELIINGLAPFLDVVQIGNTTCGKPYGMVQGTYCGQAYFPIQFESVNSQGVGGYVDGIVPTCAVADDLTKQLGDGAEGLLAEALQYRGSGTCSASLTSPILPIKSVPGNENQIIRSPLKEMQFP